MLPNDFHSQAVIAASVLTSSFLGSAHCLGMCGPIVMIINKSFMTTVTYHLGRLLGYLALGFIAGFVGKEVLGQFPHGVGALIAPLTLGASFIYMAILLYRKQRFHLPLPKFLSRPYSQVVAGAAKQQGSSFLFTFLIGIFSFTLPCGWLYGFVIGAAASKSLSTSMMIMFMFWLGTVPALLITPLVFQKIVGPLKEKFPTMASLILLVAGVFIIVVGVQRTL